MNMNDSRILHLIEGAKRLINQEELMKIYKEYELPPDQEAINGPSWQRITGKAMHLWERICLKKKNATEEEVRKAAIFFLMTIDVKKYRLNLYKATNDFNIAHLFMKYSH